MSMYYFNDTKDRNGKHEVHKYVCSFLPKNENRTYIGNYDSCHAAIAGAKSKFPSLPFDGCYYCSNPCHRG